MDVLERLDRTRIEVNVLEHPFYERWSAGQLTETELSVYVGEYRHAVAALAETSTRAAATAPPEHRHGLERHAAEEHAHVELWDRFARAARSAAGEQRAAGEQEAGREQRAAGEQGAAGGSEAAGGLAQTRACVAAWTAGEDALEHLAVLYAIEASQPAIAKTKLDGLVEHYGYAPEGPAVEYFTLHKRLDVEHSRQAAELIERLLDGCDDREALGERMVARARAALQGNWELLSGVEALASTGARRTARLTPTSPG